MPFKIEISFWFRLMFGFEIELGVRVRVDQTKIHFVTQQFKKSVNNQKYFNVQEIVIWKKSTTTNSGHTTNPHIVT